MYRKAGEWWEKHVVRDVAPDPVCEEDTAILYPRSAGTAIKVFVNGTAMREDLLAIRKLEADVKLAEERLGKARADVKARMGEAAELVDEDTAKVLATWKDAKNPPRIDMEKLKRDYPDAVESCTTRSGTHRRFRINDRNL